MTPPTKTASQLIDEQAEALATARHHLEEILATANALGSVLDVRAHARAGLDAIRNLEAGKE